MTGKIVYTDKNNTEADLFLSDGGVASFHHNQEHMISGMYQRKLDEEYVENEEETIWDFLGEGKLYETDWEGKQEIDKEMIQGAINWLGGDIDASELEVVEYAKELVV